jgi:Fe-S cluster biosynthesis and repair protein YggX
VKHQQALINHHGLHVQEPEHRQVLYQHLEQFLFSNSPAS